MADWMPIDASRPPTRNMDMNRQQMIALRNPCFEATECNDGRFFYWHPLLTPTIRWSIGVTMNIGME